jgi:hypothetical protein
MGKKYSTGEFSSGYGWQHDEEVLSVDYFPVDSNTQLCFLYNKRRQGLSRRELTDLKKYLFDAGPEPRWIPEYVSDKEWLAEYFEEELNGNSNNR